MNSGCSVGMGRRRKSALSRVGFFMALPAVIFTFLFLVYPMFDLVRTSFLDYSPLRSETKRFVGFANYAWMLRSDTFWHSLYITLVFTILSVAVEMALGLLAAVILSRLVVESRSPAARLLVRAANGIFILPFAIPGIVAAIAWKMLLHPQFSPINSLLHIHVAWFTEFPMLSVVAADSWKMMPFILFISMSALLSIDNSQFEAAKMDGANARQEFTHLTLPAILPVLAIICAFRAVDAFTKVFDTVLGTTGGGPGDDTRMMPLLIWQMAFSDLHFGQASCLAVFAIVVSIAIGWGVMQLKRWAR